MTPEIRRIRPGEGLKLRALRLSALADAPMALGSTLARKAAFPKHVWQERAERGASEAGYVTFIAARDGGWIGRWLQGLVLILLVFGAALVGTSEAFRTEQPAFRPEAIETASRLLGALVVVASVYSYAFLRGWPRRTLPP